MNDGLDDLINHIDKMQKNAERLNGKNEFTNDELFSRPFMLQHTYNTYSSLDEFLNASKFADIPFEEIPDDEWTVKIDRIAYARIIGNLISNAITHGQCSLIEIELKKNSGYVFLSVSNNGISIPEDAIPFIFERLYQCDTSRSGSGNGLGLAIVRELTGAMSGEITVRSIPGGKTVFCLSFPLIVRKN